MEAVTSTIFSVLGLSPLLILSALGILITMKSGVFNIGVQGNIAIGTTMGILGVFFFGSIWAGLLLGFISGIFVAILLGYLTINRGHDQLQTGFGIWFIFEGIAGVIYFMVMPSSFRVTEELPSFNTLDPIFFLTIAFTIIYFLVIHKMKYGLAIVATGENPGAADVAGINVLKVRWISIIIGSGLMGLAGSWFSIVVLKSFFYNMVAGYGWLAILTVIFSGYSVIPTFLSAIGFSFLIGIQTRIQLYSFLILPREIILVLPYIFGLILLISSGVFRKKTSAPGALGKPYERE